MSRILVVDDEVRLARAVGRGLTSRGFDVLLAYDGHAAYRLAKEQEFDAIVLDIMLPGLSGLEVCTRLRDEAVWTPILALTAKDLESDETSCLEMGADDYLRKPFSFSVLAARCSALTRRGPAERPPEIVVDDLALDPGRRTARRGGIPIPLSRREFALLEYLMRNAGLVRSKDEILRDVWEGAVGRDANLVEVYIGYLRRKVDHPFDANSLTTVRGRGYRLEHRE